MFTAQQLPLLLFSKWVVCMKISSFAKLNMQECISCAWKLTNVDWNQCVCVSVWEQVEVQSLLFAEVMGGDSKNAIKSVTKLLNKLWKDVSQTATRLHLVMFLFRPGGLLTMKISVLVICHIVKTYETWRSLWFNTWDIETWQVHFNGRLHTQTQVCQDFIR